MNEQLFNLVEATSGDLCVMASELYDFLEVRKFNEEKGKVVGSRFNDWFKNQLKFGFIENVDYLAITKNLVTAQGNKTTKTDYYLKMDMAKEISMIQRNEKGKQARQFFIAAEKERNQLRKELHEGKEPSYMIDDRVARATRWIEEQAEMKQLALENEAKAREIEELEPKAQYHDVVLNDNKGFSMTVIAKEYGKSATELNNILNKLGIIYKQDGGNSWVLYAKYQNEGYQTTKTIYRYGQTFINYKWTQKGRKFIYETLAENGVYTLKKMREMVLN